MSKIKNMLIKDTSTWVEFPDIEGFELNLHYLNREELLKIRKASLTYKFNKRTRQREEEVDNDKFLEHYSAKVIKEWKGLRIKHLPLLMPVDISSMNGDELIDYTEEEALDLLKNSTVFDQFITDMLGDFEQFSRSKQEDDVKN